MSSVKIAVIGAGSFVFGPSVLKGVLLENRLAGCEIALMDPAREVVEPLAEVGRRVAREVGVDSRFSAHDTRRPALEGADFVICSAAVQVKTRFLRDVEVIRAVYPEHLLTEFGGVAGFSSTLRQIALIEEICADIRKHSPNAWLLNAANPLPRVSQASHELGVKTAGFCSVSLNGFGLLSRILDGRPSRYPFDEPRQKYEVVMGGTNHLTWVVQLRERSTGADLMPVLRDRARAGESTGEPRTDALLRETGYLVTPGDHHIADFLPPTPQTHSILDTTHGSVDERAERVQLLHDVAAGRAGWEPVFAHESWEKPVDFIKAMVTGETVTFNSLNLINDGLIGELPANVFVETMADVDRSGPKGRLISLPPEVVHHNLLATKINQTLVRAATQRKVSLLNEAVELDPTILDKSRGREALMQCIAAHQDLLPRYD